MAEKVPLYIDFASGEIKEFAPSDKVKKTNLDSGGSGDLVGPEAATDNAIAVFSGASGKLLKDSAVLLSSKANTGTAQLMFRSETTAAITAKAGIVLVIEKIQ